jgi:protein-tyrosine phosphatase
MNNEFNFGPAAEDDLIVFGARRPEGLPSDVTRWIAFVRKQGIQSVVCLLSGNEFGDKVIANLLDVYEEEFGDDRVLHAPIVDYRLANRTTIKAILNFLAASEHEQEKVVVHCSAGMGRTGQVLACWLVVGRNFEPLDAIKEVRRMGRSPTESRSNLMPLLEYCRDLRV